MTVASIQMYGWDARSATWHGPNELQSGRTPSSKLISSLRGAPGDSWYGPVNCCSAGEPATRFFAVFHRVADCATAMIYCNDSKTYYPYVQQCSTGWQTVPAS